MARYLAPFNPELVELDPVLLEELDVRLRIRLRAQVPGLAKERSEPTRHERARELARGTQENKSSHDAAEIEGLQEPEVGGLREAGAEDAVVDHGEVERRHERRLVAWRRRRHRQRYGTDLGQLLDLPQLQGAHPHGALPLVRFQEALRRDLQLHGFARTGGGQSRKTESRWWFLCLRCLERCGRAWEARLFISGEGEKGGRKKSLDKM
jgi:hypothetical protein